MEIDGLGKRCALPSCRKLDYLPVQCHECKVNFCQDHVLLAAHSCRFFRARRSNDGMCPKCRKDVGFGADAMKRHMRTAHKRRDPQCSFCGLHDAFVVNCPQCHRQFCVAHQLLEVHNCVASAPVRPLPRDVSLPKRSLREGDLEVKVLFDVDSDKSTRIISISARWSAGKVLDEIAKLAGLQQKRRWLYHMDANDSDISLLLSHMKPVFGTVRNGDTLIVTEIPPSPSHQRKQKSSHCAEMSQVAVVDLTLDDDIGYSERVAAKHSADVIDLT